MIENKTATKSPAIAVWVAIASAAIAAGESPSDAVDKADTVSLAYDQRFCNSAVWGSGVRISALLEAHKPVLGGMVYLDTEGGRVQGKVVALSVKDGVYDSRDKVEVKFDKPFNGEEKSWVVADACFFAGVSFTP